MDILAAVGSRVININRGALVSYKDAETFPARERPYRGPCGIFDSSEIRRAYGAKCALREEINIRMIAGV